MHIPSALRPLALLALAFASPPVPFASGAPFAHPADPGYVLTKNRNYDLQTMPTTTKAGGSLIDGLSESLGLTPLERIALTCAGNLQMVVSSYHLLPVEVAVTRDEPLSPADCAGDETHSKHPLASYDREVKMSIAGRVFCKATSRVRVYDAKLHEILKNEKVGIGQLLRLKGLAPRMTLHEAGRAEDGTLWRYYSMECDDMVEFDIVEEFSSDAWDLNRTP